MEFIKKHWKEILIGLLIAFSLNKCTVACNRDTKINKQQIELVQKDSIIKIQSDSLNILKIRWADAQTNQSTYQGIALGTKQALIDSVNILKNEKNLLNEKLRKTEADLIKFVKENKQLKDQLK